MTLFKASDAELNEIVEVSTDMALLVMEMDDETKERPAMKTLTYEQVGVLSAFVARCAKGEQQRRAK